MSLNINVKENESVYIGSGVKLEVLNADTGARHVEVRLRDTNFTSPRNVKFTLALDKSVHVTKDCKVTLVGIAKKVKGNYASIDFDAPRSVEIVGSWRLPE